MQRAFSRFLRSYRILYNIHLQNSNNNIIIKYVTAHLYKISHHMRFSCQKKTGKICSSDWHFLFLCGFGMQWRQLDHMQAIYTSLQADNHTKTSSLDFYRPDALSDAQPTASKHWRQIRIKLSRWELHWSNCNYTNCQLDHYDSRRLNCKSKFSEMENASSECGGPVLRSVGSVRRCWLGRWRCERWVALEDARAPCSDYSRSGAASWRSTGGEPSTSSTEPSPTSSSRVCQPRAARD